MAQTFLQTDGDIREVLHTMIYSPEFWSQRRLSRQDQDAIRAGGFGRAGRGRGRGNSAPAGAMDGRIGEPLYQCEPPTGYSDKARCVGEYRRAAQSDELFARAYSEPSPRRAGGYRGCCSVRAARARESSGGCSTARLPLLLAGEVSPRDARDAGKAVERSADFAGEARRSGQAGERRHDRGIGAGLAGISAPIWHSYP